MIDSPQAERALLVDDEPEYLEWVREYLESRGLEVDSALTVAAAIRALTQTNFKIILVDMNIPADGAITSAMLRRTPLLSRYPGIAVAIHARNRGYGAHSVIGYTVHDDDDADRELSKLSCRYVLKGRPEALKRVLASSFSPPARKNPKIPPDSRRIRFASKK